MPSNSPISAGSCVSMPETFTVLRSQTGSDSGGLACPPGALRIVQAAAAQHGASGFQQPVADRAQRPAMTVACFAQGLIARLAGGVALDRDTAPVIDCVAQTLAAGLTHQHDAALAAAPGHRRHAGQRPQSLMVTRLQRPPGLDQQSGADDPPDPRQGAPRSSRRSAVAAAPPPPPALPEEPPT